MKTFMDQDFLLNTKTAQHLYHQYASSMPIFDFHNHLSAKEIYENIQYQNLTELWLSGDHYKWRVLRAIGIDESYITGKQEDYLKFEKYASIMPYLIGNPLYHWTHLELQRYFNITTPLNLKTAPEIWQKANEQLKHHMTTRELLKRQNVVALCTTDDPIDPLTYHQKLKEENFDIQVLPTFRPDQVLNIEKESFVEYLQQFEQCVGFKIKEIKDLEQALILRIEYFKSMGCLVSDHSLENHFYAPATLQEVNDILIKRLSGETLLPHEIMQYKGYILSFLGKQYHEHQMVMQLHIGALRNNSKRRFETLGADTGFDSMNDFNYAPQLSELLNSMDMTNQLPKVVLYNLNPKDNAMLITMAGNFNDAPNRGKVQFGVPWWFNDHQKGMKEHLEALASMGVLSVFIGMLTDSRSFLSFTRHEYFRRILCNYIGELVENGEYFDDEEFLGELVQNICFNNAKNYFGLK